MAIINNVNEVLRRIGVKRYPNYLSTVDGAYIARANSEASLDIEEVCAALKNCGGFLIQAVSDGRYRLYLTLDINYI
ncbi:MAG: hypothetical protein LBL45_07910 [Treponema sp.]|nr:hypothetical protein [Treponema sp.]